MIRARPGRPEHAYQSRSSGTKYDQRLWVSSIRMSHQNLAPRWRYLRRNLWRETPRFLPASWLSRIWTSIKRHISQGLFTWYCQRYRILTRLVRLLLQSQFKLLMRARHNNTVAASTCSVDRRSECRILGLHCRETRKVWCFLGRFTFA
jgi:hypothetical protein